MWCLPTDITYCVNCELVLTYVSGTGLKSRIQCQKHRKWTFAVRCLPMNMAYCVNCELVLICLRHRLKEPKTIGLIQFSLGLRGYFRRIPDLTSLPDGIKNNKGIRKVVYANVYFKLWKTMSSISRWFLPCFDGTKGIYLLQWRLWGSRHMPERRSDTPT